MENNSGTISTDETMTRIHQFVAAVETMREKIMIAQWGRKDDVLSVEPGKRYARIVRREPNTRGGSVYCFVDMTNGDILKAASWKAPAPRGVRGSIFAPDFGVSCCDQWGIKYLRR